MSQLQSNTKVDGIWGMPLLTSHLGLFQKGDKVCLTNPQSPNYGKIGTVIRISYPLRKIRIRWSQSPIIKQYNYSPSHLRKAELKDYIREACKNGTI